MKSTEPPATYTESRQTSPTDGFFQPGVWLWRLLLPFLLVILLMLGVLYFLGLEANNLDADVQRVEAVEVGEAFNLDVLLTNTTRSEQTIVSFALETELLEQGLEVTSSIPAYRTIREAAGWTEYVFSLRRRAVVPPGSDTLLRLTLLATQPGNYKGEVLVWFNNQLRAQHISFEVDVAPVTVQLWLGG